MRQVAFIFFVFAGSACGVLPRLSGAPSVQQAANPLEYMREIYYQMYSANGTALSAEAALPSDIWSISDRGKH